MAQFDSPSEAALERLKADLSISTAGSPLEVGRGVFALAISHGAGSVLAGFNLLESLKKLGARKDEANLIYLGEAIVDDVRRLYRLNDDMKRRLQSMLDSPQFAEAVANATLHATRTNVKERLKRLAHVISNGIREGDLAHENLDDMMRLAVILTDNDVKVLKIVYEMQRDLFSPESLRNQRGFRSNLIMRRWQEWWGQHIGDYSGEGLLEFMNSSARLFGEGLVIQIQKSFANSPVQDDMELLLSGKRFYEHLVDIASADDEVRQM